MVWDWQITVSFYCAVHLINAHLAASGNLHYRTHVQVKNAINPYNAGADCPVPPDVYLSYVKLENLSRRGRYLCHDDPDNHASSGHFTYDKHFAKALKHLDAILNHFKSSYSIHFPLLAVQCPALSNANHLTVFSLIARTSAA